MRFPNVPVVFLLTGLVTACTSMHMPDAVKAAQCVAGVLRAAPGVDDVRTGVAYFANDKEYEPTVTYRFKNHEGHRRSVTFGIFWASDGYAYLLNDAVEPVLVTVEAPKIAKLCAVPRIGPAIAGRDPTEVPLSARQQYAWNYLRSKLACFSCPKPFRSNVIH